MVPETLLRKGIPLPLLNDAQGSGRVTAERGQKKGTKFLTTPSGMPGSGEVEYGGRLWVLNTHEIKEYIDCDSDLKIKKMTLLFYPCTKIMDDN